MRRGRYAAASSCAASTCGGRRRGLSEWRCSPGRSRAGRPGCRRRQRGGRCHPIPRPGCAARRAPWGRRGQAVTAGGVHGQHLTARALLRQAGGAADQRAALRTAGQADHDPLPRAPDLRNLVLTAVLPQASHPEEGQLAARSDSRAGSSSTGPRPPCPACGCCRAPYGGAVPEATCRPARSGWTAHDTPPQQRGQGPGMATQRHQGSRHVGQVSITASQSGQTTDAYSLGYHCVSG